MKRQTNNTKIKAEILNLKWEYRHLFINPGEYVTDMFNELGDATRGLSAARSITESDY